MTGLATELIEKILAGPPTYETVLEVLQAVYDSGYSDGYSDGYEAAKVAYDHDGYDYSDTYE